MGVDVIAVRVRECCRIGVVIAFRSREDALLRYLDYVCVDIHHMAFDRNY